MNVKGKAAVKLSVKDLVRPFFGRDHYLHLSIECVKKAAALAGQIRFDSVTYRRDGLLADLVSVCLDLTKLFIEWD